MLYAQVPPDGITRLYSYIRIHTNSVVSEEYVTLYCSISVPAGFDMM